MPTARWVVWYTMAAAAPCRGAEVFASRGYCLRRCAGAESLTGRSPPALPGLLVCRSKLGGFLGLCHVTKQVSLQPGNTGARLRLVRGEGGTTALLARQAAALELGLGGAEEVRMAAPQQSAACSQRTTLPHHCCSTATCPCSASYGRLSYGRLSPSRGRESSPTSVTSPARACLPP